MTIIKSILWSLVYQREQDIQQRDKFVNIFLAPSLKYTYVLPIIYTSMFYYGFHYLEDEMDLDQHLDPYVQPSCYRTDSTSFKFEYRPLYSRYMRNGTSATVFYCAYKLLNYAISSVTSSYYLVCDKEYIYKVIRYLLIKIV